MFTGGHGYFEFLDTDMRFSRQKGCSYFAMENEHWLIVGLDAAWESEGMRGDTGGLQPPQFDWLLELLASRRKKRLMLLSHHQHCEDPSRLKDDITCPVFYPPSESTASLSASHSASSSVFVFVVFMIASLYARDRSVTTPHSRLSRRYRMPFMYGHPRLKQAVTLSMAAVAKSSGAGLVKWDLKSE
jgi:hypothetical protein